MTDLSIDHSRKAATPEDFTPRPRTHPLKAMCFRLEGFIIGGLTAGLLAYAGGMQRGEGDALDWCAVKFAEREVNYQKMSDQEFAEFENETKGLRR